MTLFKNYTFTWWQMGIFKISLLSIGIAIGTYWHEAFSPLVIAFILTGIISGAYVGYVALK